MPSCWSEPGPFVLLPRPQPELRLLSSIPAGAVALAGALRDGAAPNLIELILRDNPIEGAGESALVGRS